MLHTSSFQLLALVPSITMRPPRVLSSEHFLALLLLVA
jgi:hypothetical protein